VGRAREKEERGEEKELLAGPGCKKGKREEGEGRGNGRLGWAQRSEKRGKRERKNKANAFEFENENLNSNLNPNDSQPMKQCKEHEMHIHMVFPIFIFILKENCLSKSYDPLIYYFIHFLYFAKFRVLQGVICSWPQVGLLRRALCDPWQAQERGWALDVLWACLVHSFRLPVCVTIF
jgi:hypothetical protein